jgi:hypothetical protein
VAPAAALEDRVLRVEGERDEREEAARPVLLVAQPEHVLDPLLVRLDVPVEQRAVRRDPHPVRRVVRQEPEVRMLLAGGDERAHAVGEDLRAAAGERPEARGVELAQHLLVREAGELRHVVDLARRVELEVHIRHRLVQRAGRVDVELEVHVRVLAVDHVDLGEPGQLALAQRVLDELLGRDRVRLRLLLGRGERAELALHAADVRLVEIEVLDEVDVVRPAAHAACEVGELAEREQVVGLEQREAVLEIEPLVRLHLLADRLERGDAVDDGHQRLLCTTRSVSASSSSRRGCPSSSARALRA